MPSCDYPGCKAKGEKISRLSPEGYLVAQERKLIRSVKHIDAFTIVKNIMMN